MNKNPIPKYQQLKNEIIHWIQSGHLQIGQLVPSENELTERFDVSRHTVRQTFALLEQQGWIERVQGKGTYVKIPVKANKSKEQNRTIGMITTYISDYIFPHIIHGAEAMLRSRGYQLILSSTDNDKDKEREALERMLNQNIAGIIIEPTKSAETNLNHFLYQQLKDKQIPFVMINERYDGMDCPCVKMDDELGSFRATEHLIQLGHRKIAGFFKTDDRQGVKRLLGFERACRQYAIELPDNHLTRYSTEEKFTIPYQTAQQILQEQNEHPTAFVCYNDELAVQLLDAARLAKVHIPNDLSIVGFDDSALATATEVKLSSVVHPKAEMGEKAAQMLMDWIENGYADYELQDVVFSSTLVERSSVHSR